MGKISIPLREQEEFIRNNYLKMPSRQLAVEIGRSKSFVLSFLRKEGLVVPKEVIKKFRTNSQKKKTTITPEQEKYIVDNYLSLPLKRIAKNIGRSNTLVRTRLRQLGLEIPEERTEANRKAGRFDKGHAPFNKGKRMADICSPESMEKYKATWFQKGNVPANAYEKDGAISVVNGYKWIRISLGQWKQLHIHNWEKVNGEIPEGMLVVFKNGNKMDCDISNLTLLTRSENMERNTIMRYPPNLRTAMRTLGRINKKLERDGK